MASYFKHVLLISSLIGILIGGCSAATVSGERGPLETETASQEGLRVSDREANTNGIVLIVEYHHISKEEARWDRSIKSFKNDLRRLYDLGFRPVTLNSYLDDRMDLPPGASPVIFTFDDSAPSQFRLLEDGSTDPDCAVGIWLEFAQEHPDFPVVATFYVLPPTPWAQRDHLEAKLRMLKEWGCEIGSHTMTHSRLDRLSDSQVEEEFSKSKEFISGLGFEATSLALPFGISPQNTELVSRHFRAALLVGANPAPAPGSFDPLRLPRIQAIEGDFGLTYWLDLIEKGDVAPYVAPH